MKLTANYLELSNLIYDRTGKQIELDYGGNDNSFIAKYMNIPCYVYIAKVESDSITFSYRIGNEHSEIIVDPCPSPLSVIGGLFKRGAQKLGNKAADIILEKIVKHPAVTSVGERTFKIDLNKIPQMNATLKFADIENISVDEISATLDINLKNAKQI